MLNTADISTKELKLAMNSEALKIWNNQFGDTLYEEAISLE